MLYKEYFLKYANEDHIISKQIIYLTRWCIAIKINFHLEKLQGAQLSQRDRAAGCVIVFAKSRRLELGDNILLTL